MCGRFSLVELKLIHKTFQVANRQLELLPHYNVAPSQSILAVRNDEENHRELTYLRWGFIPRWQKKEEIGTRWINVRAETASQKPLFRYAFRRHRCLIVASSFFEWRNKQPYLIHCDDFPVCGMAGLWEHWEEKGNGSCIDSAVIMTQEATPPLDFLHNRMPLIIHPEHFGHWLDRENQDIEALEKEITSQPSMAWSFYPVNPRVNSARNDEPLCIAPLSE
jgi:putative SOS response-associated peptidase YedK